MKSTFTKVLCVAVLLLATGISAQAQFRHFRQSIYLNGVLPTGDFASTVDASHNFVPLTNEQIGKAAIVGFGAGYRASYRFDIGMGEVAPFIGADLFWNMISSEWSDKYLNANMTTPSYMNIPVLAGVSYNYDELNTRFPIIPFGEFGVGADMFIITREGTTAKTNSSTYYAYKPSISVAWMLGAGVYLGNYVSVGVYYYGLGKHTIDYTDRCLDKNSVAALQNAAATIRQTRNIGEMALRIGFHF